MPTPHAPWERPTNENSNALIWEYLPKGIENASNQPYRGVIADELNDRPRQTIGFHAPREVFEELILNSKVASTS